MINLKPVNKYVLVLPLEEEEEENKSSVLIPEGVIIQNDSPHAVVELIEANPLSEWTQRIGSFLVTSRHSIETFVFQDCTYYLLPESHIIAFFDKDSDE